MAESYFELLTGQQGLPVKSFDPLAELRLLRRKLDLRLQKSELPAADTAGSLSLPAKIEVAGVPAPPLPCEPPPTEIPVYAAEPAPLEAVVEQVENLQTVLTTWQSPHEYAGQRLPSPEQSNPEQSHPEQSYRGQPGQEHAQPLPDGKKTALLHAHQNLDVPQGRMLETLNACLTALGVIGAVYGVLTFHRGWEGDLPLSSWICMSGAAIIALGLSGRFLAACCET